MIFDGVELFVQTLGVVQFTEFQLLITVINILAVMMIWMAIYTFKKIIVGLITKKGTEANCNGRF